MKSNYNGFDTVKSQSAKTIPSHLSDTDSKWKTDPLDKAKSVDFAPVFLKNFRLHKILLNISGFDVPGATDGQKSKFRNVCLRVHQIFCGMMQVLLLVRLVAYCILGFGTGSEKDIADSLITLTGFVCAPMLFCSCQYTQTVYFRRMYDAFKNYHEKYDGKTFLRGHSWLTKCLLLMLTVLMVTVPLTAIWNYKGVGPDVVDPFHWTVGRPVIKIPVYVFYAVQVFFCENVILMLLFLYLSILNIIVNEFERTAVRMKKILEPHNDALEADFDECRERHQCLCRMVDIFGKLSAPYVGITIVTILISSCAVIYGLSGSLKNTPLIDILTQSAVSCFLYIFMAVFLSYKWGKLPKAGHSIAYAVADANWTGMPQTMVNKMTLLIARCNSQKMGVDLCGLFCIDSSTPMMLMGTLVTYGVLAFQFPMDVEDASERQKSNATMASL